MAALALPILWTLVKVAAFVAVMLVIGKRVIPWVLHYMAHTGSRELFRLAVLSIALGVAYGASAIFDVSFALGAFFAGMILSESELSQRAATETLPLRDAFAVLFFVSVGMLVDPLIVVNDPGWLFLTLLIIVIGKSLAAFAIVRLFGYPTSHALTISASLAQIGEFSFILAGLGVSLALLPPHGRDLILAGAILSILLNPVLFVLLDWYLARGKAAASAADLKAAAEQALREPIRPTELTDHVVLVGFGRVGHLVSDGIKAHGLPHAADRGKPPARHPGARGGARGDAWQRGHRRGDRGGQPARRAASDRRHPRCVRGRADRDAGEEDQSDAADHRPLAFRGGDRAPQVARRHHGHHGRARDRHGHAGRHRSPVGAASERLFSLPITCTNAIATTRAEWPPRTSTCSPTAMPCWCSAPPG